MILVNGRGAFGASSIGIANDFALRVVGGGQTFFHLWFHDLNVGQNLVGFMPVVRRGQLVTACI